MAFYDLPTNFSNGTASVTNLGKLMEYSNYVTDGWFGYGFLLLIFAIVFGTGMSMNSQKAILAASFVTFVFSVYFVTLGLVPWVVSFACLAGIIIGALASKAEGKM